MPARPEIGAVILAGGRGTRMGGADKGLVDYRGRPLVEWVLDALRPQIDDLCISANRNIERYAAYGVPVVTDSVPDFAGPLAGVLAALEAHPARWLLAVPCDVPALPADLALRLLHAACAADAPLAVAVAGGRTHYTHMLVRCDLADDLRRFLREGGRAVRAWQARHVCATVEFDAAGFANCNRDDDLRA
jgi:molybdopterin-guanine dinucleotide biosynthesis protein A